MNDDKTERPMRMSDPVAEHPTEDEPEIIESVAEVEEIETPRAGEDFVPSRLYEEGKVEEFRARWQDIQAGFVDDPRNSVKKADELVAKIIDSIEATFANQRSNLEDQWKQGKEISTEDLRVALKHYRSFFDQLIELES